MKIAQLTFVGSPGLPPSVQEQIAKTLIEPIYDDPQQGQDEVIAQIRDAWQQQGYFTVKVVHSDSQTLEETPERKTVALTVNIDAGTQYRLSELRLEPAASFDAARPVSSARIGVEPRETATPEQLRTFFPIHKGDIFDTDKIRRGIEDLRKAYGAQGFINVLVLPKFKTDEANGLISAILEVHEGQQFHVGKVDVRGADPGISQSLAQSGLTSGSVFDASRLEEFLVRNKPIFPKGEEAVQRHINEEENTIDLTFDVPDCAPP